MEESQSPRCEDTSASAQEKSREKVGASPAEQRLGDDAVGEDKVLREEDDDDDDDADDDYDYTCRICSYKAADVCSFSQHLHSAHPVTSLSGPSSPTSQKSGGGKEGGGCDDGPPVLKDRSPEEPQRPLQERTELPDGSASSTPKDSEKTNKTTCTVEKHLPVVEQRVKKTVKNTTETKTDQRTSAASVLSGGRKATSISGSSKRKLANDASSGTATLNRTQLVCLPLVSEGLKLVWVRSEQTQELDSVSELVEAFNGFPYPTEEEARALARRCSLSPDQVRVWFMMQRVRYGISWAEDDIHETRLRLHRLHQAHHKNDCEEEEGENEFDFLENQKNRPEELQHCLKRTSEGGAFTGQVNHTPSHTSDTGACSSSVVGQYTAIAHYTNGLEQLVSHLNEGQSVTTFDHSSLHAVHPQSNSDLKHTVTHKSVHQSSTALYQAPVGPHSQAQDGTHRGPAAQLRKKSKAQLLVLRRSFVNLNWPSEAEVQRLQRVTGLGRHEIRKWFADSRYQLRRSGRAWMARESRRNQSHQSSGRFKRRTEHNINSGLYEGSESVGLETGAEFELDVDMEDNRDLLEAAGGKLESRQEEEIEDMELRLGHRAIIQEHKGTAKVPSPSPASSSSRSSPSPSFLQGRAPEPYIRKKTQQQLNVLRSSFLRCQWPTSDDYTILQQKTGLTRTEIVQWFGDTRYHIKHSNMRWISPEDRDRVMVGISKQQRRGGKNARSRSWLDGANPDFSFKEPRPSNGTGGGGDLRTWGELYEASPSVLPEGEL